MIAIVYFDGSYFAWADIYLRSLKIVEPDVKVLIYAYNMSKGRIRKLRTFPNVLDIIPKQLSRDKDKSEGWRYQLTCNKGGLIGETLKKYPDEDLYMITDIDLLFRKNLELPKTMMNFYDIGFVMTQLRSNDPDKRLLKGMGGMIFTKNSELTREFWRQYHKLVMKGTLFKNKDQRTLAMMFEKFSSETNCKFYMIDYGHYLNASNWEHAYVWSPHKSRFGTKEERMEFFRKELKKLEDVEEERKKKQASKIVRPSGLRARRRDLYRTGRNASKSTEEDAD